MEKPLSMVKEGRSVRIKRILSGWTFRKRLNDLGLYEGAMIKVIKNSFVGPVLIKVLDSRLILGRGEANKIMVE